VTSLDASVEANVQKRAEAAFHQLGCDAGSYRIAGVPVKEIVQRYGTPIYVIDGEALSERIASIQNAFDGAPVRLFYSMKANANLAVVRRCLERGLGIDACSLGDVAIARAAGAEGRVISYTGVGLRDAELRTLTEAGVHLNLDSAQEVARFAVIAAGRPVGIRVAPNVDAGFHPHCRSGNWGGKFGIDPADLPALAATLASANCTLTTLHAHIGSSIATPTPFLHTLDVLLRAAATIPSVSTVNLGGGQAARYHSDDPLFPLESLRRGIVDRLARFAVESGRAMCVALEPGELVVSECEYLVSRITVTKRWSRDGGTRDVAICDASMNLLPAHALYGTYLHVYVEGERSGETAMYDVYGCTNQTGDRLVHERTLPRLAPGDLMIVRNAGAYAYGRSTQFNERPRAGEVWAEHGSVSVARRPETVSELLEGQRIATS
jgi:diaminopimelate decarboxylase